MDDFEELAARIVVALVASGQIPSSGAGDPQNILQELENPQQSTARNIANFYWRLVEALREGRPSARTERAKRPSTEGGR